MFVLTAGDAGIIQHNFDLRLLMMLILMLVQCLNGVRLNGSHDLNRFVVSVVEISDNLILVLDG